MIDGKNKKVIPDIQRLPDTRGEAMLFSIRH